jgi:hypothetical protein
LTHHLLLLQLLLLLNIHLLLLVVHVVHISFVIVVFVLTVIFIIGVFLRLLMGGDKASSTITCLCHIGCMKVYYLNFNI